MSNGSGGGNSLTPKQKRFAEEYVVDLNATQAAIRAGYSKATARQIGNSLLTKIDIQAEVDRLKQRLSIRTQITADKVLERWWMLATADPNELVEYRRTCCRCCYGAGYRYQRTRREMESDKARWEALEIEASKQEEPPPPTQFDVMGGTGFDPRKPPHPECPECFGEGIGEPFFKDTRNLSPAAKTLYAGVKRTKDGMEIKVHNQQDALINVAKHIGMLKERHEHTGPNGEPIEHEHKHEHEHRILTDAERSTKFADLLERARARRIGLPAPDGTASGSDTG